MTKWNIIVSSIANEEKAVGEVTFCNFIYFHGELEKQLGYDLVNEEKTNRINSFLTKGTTKTKTCKILVRHLNGILKEGILYLWKTDSGVLKGLICNKDDKVGNSYAKRKQKQRVEII